MINDKKKLDEYIGKGFSERNIFSEEYVKQLERRRETYLKGYAEGFRDAVLALKEKKLVVMDSEEMVNLIEKSIKGIKEEERCK